MATTVPLLRAAIEAAVKSITPTTRPDLGRFRLLEGDEEPGAMPVNSGVVRRFMVFAGPGQEGPYQAFTDGEFQRRFMVTVVYPTQRSLNTTLRDLMESDLHDLRVKLNQFRTWDSTLADPTALLHAIVPEVDQQVQAQDGRLLMIVPLDVQYLETVT